MWESRGIGITLTNGERNAKNWLNTKGNLRIVEDLHNKPLEIINADNNSSSYIGTIISTATEDKEHNKYIVIDVGREIKAVKINMNSDIQDLKPGQKVSVEPQISSNNKNIRITPLKQGHTLDIGK